MGMFNLPHSNKILTKILIICVVILFCLLTVPFKKSEPDNNEVVFWTLQMNDFSDYINKVIKDFETQNPNVKIKWVDVPFSEGEKRTLAAVLSDNPPDLINLNPDFSALLAERGALYEISDEYTAQYNKSVLNSLKYNGKLYSLPWYATSAITIYNKELVEKSNVKLPKTFDDISNIAFDIKSKTGAFVMLPNITENDTMARILNKYGVTCKNISSAKSVYVFSLFKNLYENEYIPRESITQTHREALEKYMSGKIVFFQAGANFLNMIRENAPSIYDVTDVTNQLTGDLKNNDFSLMNFVIPEKSKHKADALKFALFLTNKRNQLELAKLANILAVNEDALKSDFYTKYDESDKLAKARIISAKQLNNVEPAYKTERNQKEINTLLNNAVQQILSGQDTVEHVLEQLSKKAEEL